jgi:hypothetical protein
MYVGVNRLSPRRVRSTDIALDSASSVTMVPLHDLGLEVRLAVFSLQQALVGIDPPLPELEPLL